MISRIIWQLNADKTIQKVTKLTNKLFANGQASAEYCLLADNILPTDVVTATITRDTHTTQYRLKYQLLNLEDGTSKYGWAVTSNGDELNFDLQTGTASLIFAFEVKVYSTIGGDLISSYTTQSDTATVYPGSAYSPKVEATDADKIFQDLAEKDVQIEELQRNKQDKTDSNLQTSDQTVVGAINETYSLANTNANKTQDNTTKIEQIRTDLQNGTLKPLNSTNADNYSENGTIASKFNEKQNEKPNGVDSLIVNDKLNSKYIPAGLGGGLVYAGTFDATGTITASEYVPELQGTLITDIDLENSTSLFFQYNGQTTYTLGDLELNFGDQIICNGDIEPNWSKIDNSDKVTSVNGKVGAVRITADNIGAVKSMLEEQAPAYNSRIEVKPSLESTSIIKEPTFDVDIDYVSAGGSNRTRMSVTKEGLTFKNRNSNEYYKPKINENTIAYESDIPNEEKIMQDLPQFTNKIEIDMSKATSLAGLLTLPIVESSNFYVNWGDGNGTMYTEATTSISHQYEDTNFAGWITIYGDWKGIQFTQSADNNKNIIIQIEYDNNITSIGHNAFITCKNLSSVKIPNSVITIGNNAFLDTALTKIVFPENLVEIGGAAFYTSNLYDVVIPSKVTTIDSTLFWFCTNLNTVILHDNITNIKSNAFRGCSKLKNIKIPQNVTNIGDDVFKDCSVLTEILIEPNSPPVISTSTFTSAINTYYVKYSSLQQYKQATNWSTYADKIYPIGGNYSETITIPSTSWDTETKTVTVTAIGATSEDRNVIIPSIPSQYDDYGIRCTAQGTMTLTFTCDEIPTEDVTIGVAYILTNQ